MKTGKRSWVALSLASAGLACATAAWAGAADPFLGRWVLDSSRSKPAVAAPVAATLVISDAGGGRYKQVTDSETVVGRVHSEITFGLDGRDYTPTTDPAAPGSEPIVEAFERVDSNTIRTSFKLNGRVVSTTLEQISADGNTLTITRVGGGAGRQARTVTVLDRR